MPGKQMAIDADLNAGLHQRDARRASAGASIEAEADFYGAMDGASKFVRGDAVAGLIITGINIVGGLFIGVVQQGARHPERGRRPTPSSTIGDGLVSQLPALLISTAAGIIVTRAASGTDLGSEVTAQMLLNPRVLGDGVGDPRRAWRCCRGCRSCRSSRSRARSAGSRARAREHKARGVAQAALEARADAAEGGEVRTLPAPLDLLELEVGYELVPLVDAEPARRADRAHPDAAPPAGAGDGLRRAAGPHPRQPAAEARRVRDPA